LWASSFVELPWVHSFKELPWVDSFAELLWESFGRELLLESSFLDLLWEISCESSFIELMELARDPILELEGFPRSLRLTKVLEASGGAGLSGMGDGSSASRWCNLSKSVSDRCCIG